MKGEPESIQGFSEFWKAYPRKVGKGKAQDLWRRLKVSKTLLATILAAIEQQKQSKQWTKSEGEFIPHPSTWLAQKRWEDEPDNWRPIPASLESLIGKEPF